MEVLGLSPVLLTIIICVVGVSYRIITGMQGKKWSEFNPTMAATTFMLALVTSVGLVAPVIDALPSDMSGTMQLAAVAGQIAVIMGIDAGVRKGQKAAQSIKDKKSKDIPKSIDDESDLQTTTMHQATTKEMKSI